VNAHSFLKQASQHGIRLTVHGDNLNVEAPRDALTPDVVAYLRRHKPEIVEALTMPLPHGPCFMCGEDTACMLTRPDGTWDWQCVPCFDRSARPLLTPKT